MKQSDDGSNYPSGMQAARIVFANTLESVIIPHGSTLNHHHPVEAGKAELDER